MNSLSAAFGRDARILRDSNFQLLLLANTLGPMGSAVLSPVLDSLRGPFGATEASIGLMISVFSAPAIVMIPLAGALADRHGRKPILIVGLLLFGGAGAAIALTTDYRLVLFLRFLQGVGFAGINPVVITSIGDLYDGSAEAAAQGFRFTESGLVQVVFPLLAGALIVLGWYWPFLLYAIALPIAVLVWLGFEEPLPRTTDGGSDVDDCRSGSLRALYALVSHRRVLAMVVARGFPVIAWIGFLTYNSILVVRVLGGTPLDAGLLVAIGSLTWAAAASQAGRLSAMFPRRAWLLVTANVTLGVGVVAIGLAPTLVVAAAGVAFAGFGFGIVLSVYRSIITGLATPGVRGRLVSLGESFGRVTGTLTPIAMGLTISGLSPAFGFGSAIRASIIGVGVVAGVVGVVCMLVANASPPPPHRREADGDLF